MNTTGSQNVKKERGFAIVLVALAIIAILAGIIFIAINPAKQLSDNRNSQRSADVTTILNAAHQYALDNNGALPNIPLHETEICATTANSCNQLVDLRALTDNAKYLTAIPKDPQCSTVCSFSGTGYSIVKSADNHITVSAPAAEQNEVIKASR